MSDRPAGQSEGEDWAMASWLSAWLYERIMQERQVFGKPGEFPIQEFASLSPSIQRAWRKEAASLLAASPVSVEGEDEDKSALGERRAADVKGSGPVPAELLRQAPDAALADMRRWGDEMQSEASRLAEAVDFNSLPYEARMAMVAVQSLVADWTALRLAESASPSSPTGEN